MAEIKIEKKKPVWPWILLVLIIIGILVYYFVFSDQKVVSQDYGGLTPETTIPEVNNSRSYKSETKDSSYFEFNREVEKYLVMIHDKARLGNDVEFTRAALIQLTNTVQAALEEKIIEIPTDQKNPESSVQENDSISDSENLADNLKKTGERIASTLESEQQLQFPDLFEEAMEIKNAITEVNPELEISEQKGNIVAFFESSGNFLKKMKQEK